MAQKIHPCGVIWIPSIHPQAGHLSEKNDNLAVQYEDVHALYYVLKRNKCEIQMHRYLFNKQGTLLIFQEHSHAKL